MDFDNSTLDHRGHIYRDIMLCSEATDGSNIALVALIDPCLRGGGGARSVSPYE